MLQAVAGRTIGFTTATEGGAALTTTKSVGATTEHLTRRELRNEPLRTLARTEPALVQSGTTIGDAIQLMREQGIYNLLVMSGDRLVGVLTERDVVQKVLGRGIDPHSLVDGFMTPDPASLPPDATLEQALELMDRRGDRTIALVDADGNLVGSVRQGDILSFVAEAFPQEILNLPPRPGQVMEQPEGG
jgi:CBS domain-containing protein